MMHDAPNRSDRPQAFSDLGAATLGTRILSLARAAAALHLAQTLRPVAADLADSDHAGAITGSLTRAPTPDARAVLPTVIGAC